MRQALRLLVARAGPAAALAAALLASAGCGGSGPAAPTGSSASPASGSVAPAALQLNAGNFDTLVLASPRPTLVEFHSPT